MLPKSIVTFIQLSAGAFLLFVLLFTGGSVGNFSGFIGSMIREIVSVSRDPGTQWMLVLCLVVYFVGFTLLERRANLSRPVHYFKGFGNQEWLIAFVVLCLGNYALRYESAAKALQVLVLITGIVAGKALAAWVRGFGMRHLTLSPIEAEREGVRHRSGILFLLLVFLAGAALVQPESAVNFYYHGVRRWSGVWENPNLSGLLMGVGVVLAAGLGVRGLRIENGVWGKILCVIFCICATTLCGIGLFKSYSRGAWLGTASGLGMLLYVLIKYRSSNPPLSKFFSQPALKDHRPVSKSIFVLLISVSVLAFWQLRSSDWLVAQRIASVGNLNDFSWRNRVVAWQGAMKMMQDRPLTGFGWAEAEVTYAKEYSPARVAESAAIQMNDYLMIGICGGVPALVCFLLHVVSVFRRPRAAPSVSLAGAVVLLVGFWFDGGLFKLPVAVVFWSLLELSRLEFGPASAKSFALGIGFSLPRPIAGALNTLSALLAVVAIGVSALHLVPPQLPISGRTLNLARRYLVQAKALNDFEFLAAKPNWAGKPLKTLLQHVELANYNRELINWKLDDEMYRNFVLFPEIDPAFDGELNWRRSLWESFYPRIRRENDPAAAAEIVVRFLRERMTISDNAFPQQSISEIWERGLADTAGFERIYVAALRSVGVAARINRDGKAEIMLDRAWMAAPRP